MNAKELLIKIMKPINLPLTKFILKRHYQASKSLSGTRDAKRVLILAPHMDDETIGPGGTIRKHANEGAEVHCVFITDGSNSVSDLSKEELKEVRMNEMEEVKNILGLTDVQYMGLPDGKVTSDEDSQKQLAAIIQSIQPDLIYCTLFVDAHPDHIETAKLLSDTLTKLEPEEHIVRMYEINCTIPPENSNCIVDISDTMEAKRKAIDRFESQAIAFDGFLALNKWKSHLVKEEVQYVENFLELSGEAFQKHHRQLEKEHWPYDALFKQVNRTDTLLWAIYKNREVKKEMYERSLH